MDKSKNERAIVAGNKLWIVMADFRERVEVIGEFNSSDLSKIEIQGISGTDEEFKLEIDPDADTIRIDADARQILIAPAAKSGSQPWAF